MLSHQRKILKELVRDLPIILEVRRSGIFQDNRKVINYWSSLRKLEDERVISFRGKHKIYFNSRISSTASGDSYDDSRGSLFTTPSGKNYGFTNESDAIEALDLIKKRFEKDSTGQKYHFY